MNESQTLRMKVKDELEQIVNHLNMYLKGENVENIKDILTRIGRGGKLPHWYENLQNGTMPNLDGKTIGSVIEMTLVAVLEKHTLSEYNISLEVNPAKGVDIPLLNLGVKSPSENYCTSEPFFSSYERLLGNESDAVILLTNYQTAKKSNPPEKIQIIKAVYMEGSEISDKNLCAIALKNRQPLLDINVALCQKMIQFLCHVNQQDWRGKSLLKLLDSIDKDESEINKIIDVLEKNFNNQVKKDNKKGKIPLSNDELIKITAIRQATPKVNVIVNACNDWVIDNFKDFGRMPNDNEWGRFVDSKLNGKIGMSFALQWRYNFGNLLKGLPCFEKCVQEDNKECV